MNRMWGVVLFLLAVASVAQTTSAEVKVALSSDPVDCYQPFKVTATLSDKASLIRAEFYVDDYRFDQKNMIPGSTETTGTFGPGYDWDHLKGGNHEAKVRLYRINQLVDEGSKWFDVAGRRCESTTTTQPHTPTTMAQVTCYSNADCVQPVLDTPYCKANNVTQNVTWGECGEPGTSQSRCTTMEEAIVVEECNSTMVCGDGMCRPGGVTETTTTETTTTTEQTTTTLPTTTTQPQVTPTSSTTTTTLLQRTNTKLDRIIEIIEGILKFILRLG